MPNKDELEAQVKTLTEALEQLETKTETSRPKLEKLHLDEVPASKQLRHFEDWWAACQRQFRRRLTTRMKLKLSDPPLKFLTMRISV